METSSSSLSGRRTQRSSREAMDDSVAPTSEAEGGKAQLAVRPVASYVPAVIDTSDLRAFLMRPGPSGAMVQCYIQRRKTGMARLFPTYELYLKEGDKFLMAARKRKKNKSSNYLISLDKDDLARNSGNFFGKLRSNFIGAHPRPAHSGSTRPATRRPTTRPERPSLTGESGPLRRRHRIYAVR